MTSLTVALQLIFVSVFFRDSAEDVCGVATYTYPAGYVYSPKYPLPYDNNEDCACSIRAPSYYTTSYILLQFETFDLEYEANCRYDWLKVTSSCFDSTNKTFCGSVVPSPIYFPSCNEVEISFHSDHTGSGGGFCIYYEIFNYSLVMTTKNSAINTAPALATKRTTTTTSLQEYFSTISRSLTCPYGCTKMTGYQYCLCSPTPTSTTTSATPSFPLDCSTSQGCSLSSNNHGTPHCLCPAVATQSSNTGPSLGTAIVIPSIAVPMLLLCCWITISCSRRRKRCCRKQGNGNNGINAEPIHIISRQETCQVGNVYSTQPSGNFNFSSNLYPANHNDSAPTHQMSAVIIKPPPYSSLKDTPSDKPPPYATLNPNLLQTYSTPTDNTLPPYTPHASTK